MGGESCDHPSLQNKMKREGSLARRASMVGYIYKARVDSKIMAVYYKISGTIVQVVWFCLHWFVKLILVLIHFLKNIS
jgi:hypothetical protein